VRIERIILFVFLALGVLLGFASNYFTKTLNSLILALIAPLVVYLVAQTPFMKLVKDKKKRWIFYNSFLTFFLVWLVIWIFLYNL
jgi:large-conductance mechanosensitive channel